MSSRRHHLPRLAVQPLRVRSTHFRRSRSTRRCRAEWVACLFSIAPAGLGGLREISAGHDAHQPLQSSEQGMTLARSILETMWSRPRLAPSLGRFPDPAENEFACAHVDLLGLITCLEPHLSHDVVRSVIAPPCAMELRLRRQLHARYLFDFLEGHRY